MPVLGTKEFDISVSTFPTNPQETLFAPLVRIILRKEQKPVVNLTTSEGFPSILEAQQCGIKMGEGWISQHNYAPLVR
jgi:hypothetical protein